MLLRKALTTRLRSGPAIACTKKKLSSSSRSGWLRWSVLSSMRSAASNSSVLRASSTSLPSSANVQQHQQDRREQEEAGQPDLHLQQRQRDVAVEQQVAVRDAGNGDQQVGHQAEKDQPGRVGAAARRVDGRQQAVGIDRRLGIVERQPGFVVHASCRPRNLGAPARAPSPSAVVRPTIAEKLWRAVNCARSPAANVLAL